LFVLFSLVMAAAAAWLAAARRKVGCRESLSLCCCVVVVDLFCPGELQRVIAAPAPEQTSKAYMPARRSSLSTNTAATRKCCCASARLCAAAQNTVVAHGPHARSSRHAADPACRDTGAAPAARWRAHNSTTPTHTSTTTTAPQRVQQASLNKQRRDNNKQRAPTSSSSCVEISGLSPTPGQLAHAPLFAQAAAVFLRSPCRNSTKTGTRNRFWGSPWRESWHCSPPRLASRRSATTIWWTR
jgi:hypothetical protein